MRRVFNSILFASALLGPLFVTLSLMAVGLLYFPRYIAAVFTALLIELAYRGEGGIFGAPASFTLTVFFALLLVELLRKFIRTQTR